MTEISSTTATIFQGIDVSLAWATPAQSLDLTTYHEGGIRPKDTFNVQLYERNVQVRWSLANLKLMQEISHRLPTLDLLMLLCCWISFKEPFLKVSLSRNVKFVM